MRPVALAEVKKIIGDQEVKSELKDYLKEYCKNDYDQSIKIIEALKSLGNIKLKEEHIIKIADFMPKNAEELNKIFNDFALTENEANEIIAIVQGA